MANTGNLDYSNIERPFDSFGARSLDTPSDGTQVINSNYGVPYAGPSVAAPDTSGQSSSSSVGSTSPTIFNPTAVATPATLPGANQIIQSGQILQNIWIDTWIRSQNYRPGKQGFNIDGLSGTIEAANVEFWNSVIQSAVISVLSATAANYLKGQKGFKIDGENGTIEANALTLGGVQTGHFTPMLKLSTVTIWVSDGTNPNGALTGQQGDICLNGSGTGQPYYCTTTNTTTWNLL